MLILDMREGSEGNGLIIGGIVLGLAGLLFFAGLVVVGFIAFGTSSRPPIIKPTPPNSGFDLTDPNQAKIEKVIREELKKPTGELTEADLGKVTMLQLDDKQLTSVKGLEKLTQLGALDLE